MWSARAVESFALEAFNTGDFYKAVDEQVVSETVSKVLYPNDEPDAGKRLRLLQQYFFVTCSLQDILSIHTERAGLPLSGLPDKWAIQLNDTHPSIAVAELMRLLIDDHQLTWDDAWDITVGRSATPTTRCCPRRWKPGRLACSARRCRATWS